MGVLAAILFLPILAYVAVQTGRDIRGRAWAMSLWGLAAAVFLIWVMFRLMDGPQH